MKDKKRKKKKADPARTSPTPPNAVRYPGQSPARKSRKTIRRQRNRRILLTALLAAVLISASVFLSLKVLFVVRQVQVSGSERYTEEEISAFCAIPREENIFRVDVEGISKALKENFTYIESARVKRKLPDKISVVITDAVPSYCTARPEGEATVYTVYSRKFKQLTRQTTKPEELVFIDGDVSSKEIKKGLKKLFAAIAEKEYRGLAAVSMPDISDVKLNYRGRVEVNLGTLNDLEYKLQVAWYVLENKIGETETGALDVSSPSNAVWRPGAAS